MAVSDLKHYIQEDSNTGGAVRWLGQISSLTLAQRITAIGSTVTVLDVYGSQSVTSLTVPANVCLRLNADAQITISTAMTINGSLIVNGFSVAAGHASFVIEAGAELNINGHMQAGRIFLFDKAATATVNIGINACDAIFPEWFGAIADGVISASGAPTEGATDNAGAINDVIVAAAGGYYARNRAGLVLLGPGSYGVSSRLKMLQWVTLAGAGMNTAIFATESFPEATDKATGKGIVTLGEAFTHLAANKSAKNVEVRDLCINLRLAPSNTAGIYMNCTAINTCWQRLAFHSGSFAKLHIGFEIPRVTYGQNGDVVLEEGDEKKGNRNGTMVEDCYFESFYTRTGCIFVASNSDHQDIWFRNCVFANSGPSIRFLGVRGHFQDCFFNSVNTGFYLVPQYADGSSWVGTEERPNCHHIILGARFNVFRDCYRDGSVLCAWVKVEGVESYGLGYAAGISGVYNTTNLLNHDSITNTVYIRSDELASRASDTSVTVTGNVAGYYHDGARIALDDTYGAYETYYVDGDAVYADGVTTITVGAAEFSGYDIPIGTTHVYLLSAACSYSSDTEITVPGDFHTYFAAGRKLWGWDGYAWRYFEVDSAVYGAPNTTVTVVQDGGAPDVMAGITNLELAQEKPLEMIIGSHYQYMQELHVESVTEDM